MTNSFLVTASLLFIAFVWLASYFCFSYYGEWFFLGHHWDFFEIVFKFDEVSVTFLFMLLCCGLVALSYCCHYFGGLEAAYSLFYLMICFLSVMSFLVVSGNFLLTLIFWEYLGFVSFLLILYYLNSSSLRAAIVTLVSSRFGDVALFGVLGWLYCYDDFSNVYFCFLVSLVVLSKSASYPFVSWLIQAMRAPTPVSSLVHSSTLVAAGVWFLLRYEWSFDGLSIWFLYISCCVTVVVSAICAASYVDLKEIVAFSTCNNISWCVLFFICGDAMLAGFQLLVHGVSKCYLFMAVGDIMSSSDSSQNWGSVYSGVYGGFYNSLNSSFLVLCLTGLPFIGVFFTKHYYFCWCLLNVSLFNISFIVFGFFLTLVYSVRFVFLLSGDKFGLVWSRINSFFLAGFLLFLSTLVSNVLSGVLEEVWVVSFFWSVTVLFLQLAGVCAGCYLYSAGFVQKLSPGAESIGGNNCFVSCAYFLWSGATFWFFLFNFRWEVFLVSVFRKSSWSHLPNFYASSSGAGWLVFGLLGVFVGFLLLS